MCPICEKEVKSISEIIRHLNTYKGHLYLKPLYKLLQYKSYNKKDNLGRNIKDEGDLLGKTVIIAIANSIFKMPIKDMLRKKLFASEFLLALREK